LTSFFFAVSVICVVVALLGLIAFQREVDRLRQFIPEAFESGFVILDEIAIGANRVSDANVIARAYSNTTLFLRRTTAAAFGAYPAGRLLAHPTPRVEVRLASGFVAFHLGLLLFAVSVAAMTRSVVIAALPVIVFLSAILVVRRERQWGRVAARAILRNPDLPPDQPLQPTSGASSDRLEH
jgi:hypothetical protein